MTCEICGCTDEMACISLATGLPCHWARDEDTGEEMALCSVCAEEGTFALRSWPMPTPFSGDA